MKKEIETNKKNILILLLYVIALTVFNVYHSYQQEHRLNEHKRLLIAQQEQINKLIINAQYNKIRYEEKVR